MKLPGEIGSTWLDCLTGDGQQQHNPMHAYLEVNPTEFKGTYSRYRSIRLQPKCGQVSRKKDFALVQLSRKDNSVCGSQLVYPKNKHFFCTF